MLYFRQRAENCRWRRGWPAAFSPARGGDSVRRANGRVVTFAPCTSRHEKGVMANRIATIQPGYKVRRNAENWRSERTTPNRNLAVENCGTTAIPETLPGTAVFEHGHVQRSITSMLWNTTRDRISSARISTSNVDSTRIRLEHCDAKRRCWLERQRPQTGIQRLMQDAGTSDFRGIQE